jgi:hypothetical protein
MRKGLVVTGFVFLLLGVFNAGAAGLGSVEVFQAPAWLHHDNVRTPLSLGVEIAENDRFETGTRTPVLCSG